MGNPEVPLDPEVVFRTLRSIGNPEVPLNPERLLLDPRSFGKPEVPSDPEVVVGPEGYKEPGGLPFPGIEEICSGPGDCMGTREATTGTYWDFAFYCSEAGHYQT
ncbi:hypothetical protein F2Q68_00032643 [Brassica cretica]|uniref:Uncharacterized protein n=1 Tax=Brassica cretica TaxID=69181 RepID=A0A8S9GGB5_BRACR|nr:hypothetical protein F2Q68_00032643 [Brassica cretica]